MDTRHLIWIGALLGGFVGGWFPSLWGAGALSMASILWGTIGGLVGIYIGHKLSSW